MNGGVTFTKMLHADAQLCVSIELPGVAQTQYARPGS